MFEHKNHELNPKSAPLVANVAGSPIFGNKTLKLNSTYKNLSFGLAEKKNARKSQKLGDIVVFLRFDDKFWNNKYFIQGFIFINFIKFFTKFNM